MSRITETKAMLDKPVTPRILYRNMRKPIITILVLWLALVILVVLASHAGAGKRVYDFYESKNATTHEPECRFSICDFKGGLSMGPCGLGRAANWTYTMFLEGAGQRFPFEKVSVGSFGFEDLRPVAGEIVLDRKNEVVTISLKVTNGAHGRRVENFIGNGTFKIKK